MTGPGDPGSTADTGSGGAAADGEDGSAPHAPRPLPTAVHADLARIKVLLEQPRARGDGRRAHWQRELALLETLALALARLDGLGAGEPAWVQALARQVAGLGKAVALANAARESTPDLGRDTPTPRNPDRRPRVPEPSRGTDARREARPRGEGRADAIADAIAYYPEFLAAERDAARRVGDARAAALAQVVSPTAEEPASPATAPPAATPEEPILPVLAAREQLVRALREHDVLLLVGETGSGKSLLSPFFALEAGLGRRGRIVHTQPRRVAARQIARRLAEMSGTELGGLFGCHTRIDRDFSSATVVKVATDGILLQELRGDPLLERYDLVILDEAHERSTTIDLLLGLLYRIRQKRPALKLLITSATLEQERFAEFFALSPAQQIVVPGRLHPVAIEYREPEDDDKDDPDELPMRVAAEIEAVVQAGHPGDVLAFLPRHKEIAAAHRALRTKRLGGALLLTLHGQQTSDENARCFEPTAQRKLILATNVAETSITLPGVRTVIDAGLANTKMFEAKTGITSLLPRPISQASAAQRAGRAGRVAPGRCIRLWSEAEHAQRKPFTEPEIRRSDLAQLVLSMANMGIEDIPQFPFVTKPSSQQLSEARRMLIELGALERGGPITALGRRMASLPLEPRVARLVLAGVDEGCLDAVLSVAAALSIGRSLFRMPRADDPQAEQLMAKAKKAKRKLAGGGGDFDAMLALVEGFRTRKWKERRAFCEANLASMIALDEILAIRDDLEDALRGSIPRGEKPPEGDATGRLARALLAGLLGNVCVLVGRFEYHTTEGESVHIHPGSLAFDAGSPPNLIAAGQLQRGESRIYARHVLPLRLEWLQAVCPQLLSYVHKNVRYEAERDRVLAEEDVFFRQLTVEEGREVDLASRDPDKALDVLIREALLEGRTELDPAFHTANLAVLEHAQELANRLATPELAPGEDRLYALYAAKLAGCRSARDLAKRVKGDPSTFLAIDLSEVLTPDQLARARAWYPDRAMVGGKPCAVSYVWNPWKGRRTATMRIPAIAARAATARELDCAIPGLAIERLERYAAAAVAAGLATAEATRTLVARYAPADDREPLAHLEHALGRALPPEIRSRARAVITEEQLEPVLELEGDGGKVLGSAVGASALRQLLRKDHIEEGWKAARAQHETAPVDQVGKVPKLFEGPLLVPVRVWGDAETGDEQHGYTGLARTALGWSRTLYRTRDDALVGTRDALAAHAKLVIALDPARAKKLACALDAKLEQRCYELTGRPTFRVELDQWLWRVAGGGFVSPEVLRDGRIARELPACERAAVELARTLPVTLPKLVDRLDRLRRRQGSGAASPADAEVLERGIELLGRVGTLDPVAWTDAVERMW